MGCNGNYPGGDGGGRIQIHAINIVADGTISANGNPGNGCQAGSGSGGSINIAVSSLSGSGTIRANGAAGEVGAGGGRIAVHYVDLSTANTSNIQALGGQGGNVRGGNGTIFLRGAEEGDGTLVVDGQGANSPFSPLPIPPGYVFDNVVMRNSARVVVDSPLVVNDTVQVLTGSVLTHSLSSETGLSIQARRVEVDGTSSIDVSAKGYRGGSRDGNASTLGLTLEGLEGARARSGGSYGGYGGVFDGSGTNVPYGHPAEPVYLGSGGSRGCGAGYPGGNGGGLLRITASEAMVIDGSLLANGEQGWGCQAGSGSGGAIRLATSLLRGTGTIAANGGVSEVGGSGGRVAITYDYLGDAGDDLNGLRNIQAFGGHGGNAWASAGTVFLKRSNQQYGDLYIDDNMGGGTASNYTPLTHVGFGEIVGLTEDTITTDGVVAMVPDGLRGIEINPNLNQAQTYVVTANTETTLTVDLSGKPGLTAVAAARNDTRPGDTYVGIYRFDNVYFRRGGFLVMGDRLMVSDTMRLDESGRLTHYDAAMNFESMLDLDGGDAGDHRFEFDQCGWPGLPGREPGRE